jgi:plastocyanin
MTDDTPELSRRGFLRAAAGTAAVTGAAGTATAQEDGGGSTATVEVGPGGKFTYSPGTSEPLKIKPGTKVKFVWKSDNHNIVVENQPEGAGWEGTAGGETKTYNTGHEYSYTFETEGTYEYFCFPHKAAGMVATIEVTEDAGSSSGGDGGGSSRPTVPDSAKMLGVASTFGVASTLGLAYFFIKYGGDYGLEDV